MLLLLLPLAPTSVSVVPRTPLTYLPDDPDLRCFARAVSAAPTIEIPQLRRHRTPTAFLRSDYSVITP